MPTRIAILLPTYNGEKYLREQLDSLLAQTYENLVLVLRDDGSSDGTPQINHSYQARFPGKFHVIDNDGRNLGASRSFSFLMDYVLAHKKDLGLEKAYMMFCDQDDVWTAEKAELEFRAMEDSEDFGADTPVLVHSDLQVVSETRAVIAESFMQYQGLNASYNRFGQILFCNLVTGCSALINESLAKESLPVPETAVMHDWWLALVASAFGKLVLVKKPLVEYRQHRANTLGAVEKVQGRSLKDLVLGIHKMKPVPLLGELAVQANAFSTRYHSRLNTRQRLRLGLASAMSIRSGIVQRALFNFGRRF